MESISGCGSQLTLAPGYYITAACSEWLDAPSDRAGFAEGRRRIEQVVRDRFVFVFFARRQCREVLEDDFGLGSIFGLKQFYDAYQFIGVRE